MILCHPTRSDPIRYWIFVGRSFINSTKMIWFSKSLCHWLDC
jgi:hypothetical protein